MLKWNHHSYENMQIYMPAIYRVVYNGIESMN